MTEMKYDTTAVHTYAKYLISCNLALFKDPLLYLSKFEKPAVVSPVASFRDGNLIVPSKVSSHFPLCILDCHRLQDG
jgi:hypothetical protein